MLKDKLLEFIRKTESEFIHKISPHLYLVKTEKLVVIIPTDPFATTVKEFIKPWLDRKLSLEEMRSMIKEPSVILSNHHPSKWLALSELDIEIPLKTRVNVAMTDNETIIFIHFMETTGTEMRKFLFSLGANQVKIIDHSSAVLTWLTPDSESNSPTYQLYNLGSDLIASALIVK